jgi:drug/metabolite transporter (DMT)-like permease
LVWWGLVCTVVAAAAFGAASVLQAIASQATVPGSRAVDPWLLVRVLRQWRFVAGVGLDVLGAVAQLIALRVLPLFVVQAALAASLAVTAILARLLGTVLGRQQWAAVGAVCVGLALVATSAKAQGSATVGTGFRVGLVIAVALLAGLGAAVARLPAAQRAPALGLIAGLGFGVTAMAGRVITGFAPRDLLTDPATYAIISAGLLAMLFLASALQRGRVTTTTALMVLGETVIPALVGVLVLGDQTRPGFTAVAITGFLIAVLAALTLARFGEPPVTPTHPTPATSHPHTPH